VIEHLVVVATKEYSAPIKGVVFTVPAYFDAVQKAGIRKAAEYANVTVSNHIYDLKMENVLTIIKVKDIIHEPEAAVVSLGEMASPNGETRVVAVVDFGGGTFDVSVVRCYRNKSFGVVTTDGDPHLGGKDIDIALVCHFHNNKKNKKNE
jgi:molecular chaperone DnaK (HSP70)